MSQHRDPAPKQVETYRRGRTIVLLLFGLVAAAYLAHYLLQTLPQQRMDTWPTSTGEIVETRVTIADILGGMYSSRIYLRPDIQVRYSAGGADYNRWVSLPERFNLTHEQMEKKVGELKGKHCQVHWKQGSPFEGYVTESLEPEITKPAAP